MARGTKKVGIAGKFGPRYGVTIRKRIIEVSRARQKRQQCPECQHYAVKRESSGIWKCRHCKLVFAAAAYSTRLRSYKKEVSTSMVDMPYMEEETPDEEPEPTIEDDKVQEEDNSTEEEVEPTEIIEEEEIHEEEGTIEEETEPTIEENQADEEEAEEDVQVREVQGTD